MPIGLVIAAGFIGLYFYRSANNIGKNGWLWVGIALGTFFAARVLASLIFSFLSVSFLGYGESSSFLLGILVGLGAGIAGLLVDNYYPNIIPD